MCTATEKRLLADITVSILVTIHRVVKRGRRDGWSGRGVGRRVGAAACAGLRRRVPPTREGDALGYLDKRLRLSSQLATVNRRAESITEMTTPHPVRATDGLAHWYQPWVDVTPTELVERSLRKWRSFVAAAATDEIVRVLDGQLFHGDLTNLFLMDCGSTAIVKYLGAVEEVVLPLTPLLIYFYQDDVDAAIRAIAAQRGVEWVKYQVNWKLQAPYSRRLGLEGLDGLISLYKNYRALTDELYAGLGLAKPAIENSQRTWGAYCDLIMQELLGDQQHDAI
jgi:hypothetical protein